MDIGLITSGASQKEVLYKYLHGHESIHKCIQFAEVEHVFSQPYLGKPSADREALQLLGEETAIEYLLIVLEK